MQKIATLVLGFGVSVSAMGEDLTRDVMRCTGNLLGAPAYTVQYIDPAESPVFYRLVKTVDNPAYGPYTVDIGYSNYLSYGETTILTLNEGRSGYAHIYDHGKLTVIDIDLFQNDEMNTDGPQTHYQCIRIPTNS